MVNDVGVNNLSSSKESTQAPRHCVNPIVKQTSDVDYQTVTAYVIYADAYKLPSSKESTQAPRQGSKARPRPTTLKVGMESL